MYLYVWHIWHNRGLMLGIIIIAIISITKQTMCIPLLLPFLSSQPLPFVINPLCPSFCSSSSSLLHQAESHQQFYPSFQDCAGWAFQKDTQQKYPTEAEIQVLPLSVEYMPKRDVFSSFTQRLGKLWWKLVNGLMSLVTIFHISSLLDLPAVQVMLTPNILYSPEDIYLHQSGGIFPKVLMNMIFGLLMLFFNMTLKLPDPGIACTSFKN